MQETLNFLPRRSVDRAAAARKQITKQPRLGHQLRFRQQKLARPHQQCSYLN